MRNKKTKHTSGIAESKTAIDNRLRVVPHNTSCGLRGRVVVARVCVVDLIQRISLVTIIDVDDVIVWQVAADHLHKQNVKPQQFQFRPMAMY